MIQQPRRLPRLRRRECQSHRPDCCVSGGESGGRRSWTTSQAIFKLHCKRILPEKCLCKPSPCCPVKGAGGEVSKKENKRKTEKRTEKSNSTKNVCPVQTTPGGAALCSQLAIMQPANNSQRRSVGELCVRACTRALSPESSGYHLDAARGNFLCGSADGLHTAAAAAVIESLRSC